MPAFHWSAPIGIKSVGLQKLLLSVSFRLGAGQTYIVSLRTGKTILGGLETRKIIIVQLRIYRDNYLANINPQLTATG